MFFLWRNKPTYLPSKEKPYLKRLPAASLQCARVLLIIVNEIYSLIIAFLLKNTA